MAKKIIQKKAKTHVIENLNKVGQHTHKVKKITKKHIKAKGYCTRVAVAVHGSPIDHPQLILAEELEDLNENFNIRLSEKLHKPLIIFDPDDEKKWLTTLEFEAHRVEANEMEALLKHYSQSIEGLL